MRYSVRWCVGVLLAVWAVGCSRPEPRPLVHEAYVWQRVWSPALGQALTDAPRELGTLRVLARERSGPGRTPVDIPVDVDALARSGREVVAVLRVDGTAPLDGVSLQEVAGLARAWRTRGVRVRGLELDHDCATAALAGYADWWERERALLGGEFTLSLTALPTWRGLPALPHSAAALVGT